MATPGSRLNDENYLNWLRGSLSLLFLKEGIESFTNKRVIDLHERLQGIVSQQPGHQQAALCNACTFNEVQRHKTTWRVKCSSKTCNTWLKQILRFHADGTNTNLARTNLKPQLWPTQPWEVAKCFLPCGSENVKSAKDADVAAVLKLMRSCLFMYTFLDRSLVQEVLEVRHRLMHSNSMTTSDVQLQRDTDKIIKLLNSLVDLSQEESDIAQKTIDNISKLRDKILDITTNNEVIVLTSRMNAVEGDLAILKDRCNDLTKTTRDLQSLEAEIDQLNKARDSFENFLQKNDLDCDVAKLSKRLAEHGHRFDLQDARIDQQDERLNERLGQQNERLNQQDERLGQQDERLNERLGQQDERLNERLGQQDERLNERLGQQDERLNERLGQQDERLNQQGERLNQQGERLNERLGQQDEKLNQQDEILGQQNKRLNERLGQQDERLNERVGQQDGRLNERLGQQDERLNERLDQQNERLNERLGQQDERLDQQDERLNERLDQQAQKMDQQGQRLDQRLSIVEERTKNTKDATADRDVGSWEEQCNELQAMLMQHYRDNCLLVQNPVNNTSIGMEYMYVEPAVRILRESKGRDGLSNVKDNAEGLSCRKIFYTDNYRARQIYITGDAGLGKSMLCKHLVELWCEAHGDCVSVESDESDTDSEEENWRKEEKNKARTMRQKDRKDRREENKHILSQFKFLFYITLRDCLSEYKLSDMIQSQLLQHYDDIKHVQASDVLKKECCLVIVDGLDEWVCPKGRSVPHFVNPGIPGRNTLNKNNVFLTTTRPWKFDVLELNDSDVDKHAELCGLEKLSASQFCSKIIKLLNKSKAQRKKKKEFFRTLKQKGLGHFKTIPVILIQLICLWFDDQELCQSQVQLYCAMLNLLLKRAQTKVTGQTKITPRSETSEVSLHKCFMSHPYCQNHQQLIHCLSKVAFEALVNKTKEKQLVFESSQMVIYGLDEESVNMCLKYGILSQSKMFDKCAVSEKKFSFLHKKFQEFLASVYIANSDDVQDVAKRLTNFCGTLKDCLEMSQVWLFVCGMSPDIARHLLKHFTDVITADTDKQMQKYRQNLRGQGFIRDIQTFVADCLTEGENNGYKYDKISLMDVYIDRHTFSHVERALPGNIVSGGETIYCRTVSHVEPALLGNVTSCIKSMYINTDGITVDQSTRITGLLLHSQAVQKLHLNEHHYMSCITRKTLTIFLHNCSNKLTCIDLCSKVTLTESGVTSICHSISECLMALRLQYVRLTHVDTVKLLNGLSQSHTIRHLDLFLGCTDHVLSDCILRIDMSTMTQLQTLGLSFVCVDNLPTVTQCIFQVYLAYLTLPMAALCEFARRISQTKRYVDVKLFCVTVREEREDRVDLETFLRGCPGLTVTFYKYCDCDNPWVIDFHTNKQ